MTDQVILYTELYPIAEQASRIIAYFANEPVALANSDAQLASVIGAVSAQQVATVKRVLVRLELLKASDFSYALTSPTGQLLHLSAQLEGAALYLRQHRDRDNVKLIITEPGPESALRAEVDRRFALPPLVFQTADGFIALARLAQDHLTVLIPFMDHHGAEFLIRLYELTRPTVIRRLICRPLTEEQCGLAFNRRRADFAALRVEVYEYARPSSLPSGRETFHGKMMLADETSCYIGSSNMMASALERSLEVGVIVTGKTASFCHQLLESVVSISARINYEQDR